MKKLTEKRETVTLNTQSIDEASNFTAKALEKLQMPRPDIYRCRLSVEEALLIWSKALGEDTECLMSCGSRFGRPFISLSVPGAQINPSEVKDDLYGEVVDSVNLIYRLGLTTVYSYAKGRNEITLSPPRKSKNGVIVMVISIALSLAIGLPLSMFFPAVASALEKNVVTPIFSTAMNLIFAIAGPLIFLSICSGIYSIGNISAVGQIAKVLVSRFLLMTFLPLAAIAVLTGWMFPIALSGSTSPLSSGAAGIFGMILNIVPSDIITPFQTGNALQIIFLAVACGSGILILGKKVSELAKIVNQIYSLVQFLMETIGRVIPAFVFLSILSLILSSSSINFSILGKQVILSIAFIIAIMVAYILFISIKWSMSPLLLMKKLLSTFLIAITTASSAAAFSVNLETCEKKLGISRKMVDFGVPLGQVIFMPPVAISFFFSSLCIGEIYGVEMTLIWILTAFIISGVLAVATPPIPGGTLSCFTILFMQLGIPAEGIALAISISMLMEYILTAGNLMLLQGELVLSADKLKMLDTEILKGKG